MGHSFQGTISSGFQPLMCNGIVLVHAHDDEPELHHPVSLAPSKTLGRRRRRRAMPRLATALPSPRASGDALKARSPILEEYLSRTSSIIAGQRRDASALRRPVTGATIAATRLPPEGA
jgi:hypothetical protein